MSERTKALRKFIAEIAKERKCLLKEQRVYRIELNELKNAGCEKKK